MGHSWVEVEISDLEKKKFLESLGFAVDPKTGALREEPLLLY